MNWSSESCIETRAALQIGAVMLLAGFCWPILSHSLVFGTAHLVWPWHLIGGPSEMDMAAAMATPTIANQVAAWTLLPLFGGIGVLLLRRLSEPAALAAAVAGAGAVLLAFLLVIWFEEAEALGLAFTPPTWEAGIMLMLVALSGALVAACNRVRKEHLHSLLARRLSLAGGIALALLTGLFVLAADGVWAAWPMMLLYVMAAAYAVMAIVSSVRVSPSFTLLANISVLGKAIVVAAGLAMIIAQSGTTEPYVDYVTQAGGGFFHVLMSVIKGYLVYFASAYLLASGIAALVELRAHTATAVASSPGSRR